MLDSQKILSKILSDGVDPSYFDICSVGDILMMKTPKYNNTLEYYIVTEVYDDYLLTDRYNFYKQNGIEVSNKQKNTKITLPINIFKDIHIKVSIEELDRMKEKLIMEYAKYDYIQYNAPNLLVNSASSTINTIMSYGISY